MGKLMNHGWVCPVCGRVNAPWKATCDCNGNSNYGTYAYTKNKTEKRLCMTCMYSGRPTYDYPCNECDFTKRSKWEPRKGVNLGENSDFTP